MVFFWMKPKSVTSTPQVSVRSAIDVIDRENVSSAAEGLHHNTCCSVPTSEGRFTAFLDTS